jgi:hypothetical protein
MKVLKFLDIIFIKRYNFLVLNIIVCIYLLSEMRE